MIARLAMIDVLKKELSDLHDKWDELKREEEVIAERALKLRLKLEGLEIKEMQNPTDKFTEQCMAQVFNDHFKVGA